MATSPGRIPARVRFVMVMERVFRAWLVLFVLLFLLVNILPLLAPLAMQSGAQGVGNALYDLYGIVSHQYAHRSYFFFGQQLTYTLEELPIELRGDVLHDTTMLKAFRGNETYGWKMAWSDRMMALAASWWLSAVLYGLLSWRSRARAFPLWLGLLCLLPLVIDGTTHWISDFDGLTAGFRYTNDWLAALTGNAFPQEFYVGDAPGSFNAWARLITGVLFGIGMVGYFFPRLERYFRRNADILALKLADWRQRQEAIRKLMN